MAKIRAQNLIEIKTFFKDFTIRIIDTISNTIDAPAKDFKIELFESKESENLDEFKNTNHFMFSFNPTFEKKSAQMLIMVPEELLLLISDLMMGGDGNVDYKGALTEVQVNSSFELMQNLLNNIKQFLKNRHNKDITYAPGSAFYLKDSEDYEKKLNIEMMDFQVSYRLKIREEQSFDVSLLCNEDQLREVLTAMSILSMVEEIKVAKEPFKNLSSIKDIKVDIIAELGTARIPVKKALELTKGSLIELETLINSDIKVYANEIEIGAAKVVAVDDYFGIQITKINSKEERENIN